MYSKVKVPKSEKFNNTMCTQSNIKVNSQKEKGNLYYNVSYKTILKRLH